MKKKKKPQHNHGGCDGAVDKTHAFGVRDPCWIHCETPMCPWARHL